MRRAKLIAVRPWNLRRIALYAVEVAVNPVVLIDKRPVSDLTERGPVTRRGLRRCIDFEVRDDADPILGFHDHPSQMWVADPFAHVAKHCAEQGWPKIEETPRSKQMPWTERLMRSGLLNVVDRPSRSRAVSMWRRILGFGKPTRRDVKQSFDQGDPELVDAVSGFIDSTFGSGGSVFHEVASSLVHIDLWFVPPGRERPWITVLTSGMAEKPLPSHPDFRGPSRVELVLALSADWPLDPAAWRQERNWWPMRMLKEICRYPHGCGMPVGVGHTLEVPALSGNQFGFHAVLLVPPKVFGGAMPAFPLRGEQVCFLSPVPIFEDELQFARTAGSRELWNRLAARPIPELVGPRPSVAKR